MTHSMPSDATILDKNSDGYIDRVYIGDTGRYPYGNRPPDDWVGDDYKQAHPDWWANYANRS